ncbi:MAG TPA: spermidine synthase, partial [Syntrophomonadaceae bacterium]|nr:spermidine synthase [Syntrophomonadaceae bacterium]
VGLYSLDFYQNISRILAEDGMMIAQSESPLFYQDIFQSIYRNIRAVYPIARVYLGSVPTYVAGPWSFTAGSKKYDPSKIIDDSTMISGLQYYNREIHRAAFCLPPYIEQLLRK